MTKLSVYDFDKTIYNGETLNDFYRFYLIKKPWKIYTVFFQLWYFLLYVLKIISLEKLKENFLRFLNGENTGELKELIKEKHFDIVFCSDLKRATQSSKLMFEEMVDIIQDKRLRECNYGIYNGKSSVIVEPLQEKYIENKFPGGESYEDVKNRIYDFLNYLKIKYN